MFATAWERDGNMVDVTIVSIPFRGFRCLQRNSCFILLDNAIDVSIPFRGFRCLQRFMHNGKRSNGRAFQSLSGVLGVCNKKRSLLGKVGM